MRELTQWLPTMGSSQGLPGHYHHYLFVEHPQRMRKKCRLDVRSGTSVTDAFARISCTHGIQLKWGWGCDHWAWAIGGQLGSGHWLGWGRQEHRTCQLCRRGLGCPHSGGTLDPVLLGRSARGTFPYVFDILWAGGIVEHNLPKEFITRVLGICLFNILRQILITLQDHIVQVMICELHDGLRVVHSVRGGAFSVVAPGAPWCACLLLACTSGTSCWHGIEPCCGCLSCPL